MFTFLEVDLRLDLIPFDDLTAKYRVEAAITADFTGINLDAGQYALMERGPEWKEKRLRFTVAHERLVPNFTQSGTLRDKFAERVATRFGVNAQVIAVRLDRDGI